ncbi:MAG: SBBP repeat-containing protein, partial [Thermodesulfobacteriota bacterium]|nr:SBBP repeat-containing protein [Thermodesulfobacteriota bacterium]
RLGLNKDGALVLGFPGGEVVQPVPVIYQEDKGGRRPVSGRYVLLGQNRIGFNLAGYDRSRPLIIDPVLVYSTYLGGSGDETGWSIAVDSSGAAYVAGETDSLDFPQAGLQGAFGTGETDAFAAKLNPSGTALVYATYLGGSGVDSATSLTVDSSGAAYLTGYTDSNDFPLQNPGQGFLSGLEDAFVTKLNPSGSALVFSTYLGGGLEDRSMGVAVDSLGAVYITGFTRSANYPVTGGVIQGGLGGFGHYDAFVTKLNDTASALFYSTYLGGGGDDYGQGLGLDSSGNVFVTGHTDSADFPTAAPYQDSLSGGRDAFVAKLNDTGTVLVYSTYLGGSGDDNAQALAVSSSGAAHITGSTTSQDFPTAGYQNSFGGRSDAFVTRFNTTGQTLVYSTYLGGSGDDFGSDIALDSSGNAYLAGFTGSADFPETSPSQALSGGGALDGFAAKLNATGSALIYSTYIGGSGSDSIHGIAVDDSGNAYVTGNAESEDFPTAGYQVLFGGGGSDAFVLKIDADPDTVPPTVISSSPADKNTGINITTSISATFSEPMDPDT